MPTLYQSVESGIDPWAVQQRISTSDARYALASTLMPISDSSFIEYRSGVMASGDGGDTHLAGLVQPVSGMTVSVNPANVVLNTPGSGPYMGAINETVQLTLQPASSTANRIDVVLVRVYDDLNPAIGSEQGERKLAVEVWTGDETTGTPSAPTIPIPSGWHPLAHIRVDAGTTSITSEMIEDKRGPGLVTRGGMRALYGPDAVVGSPEYNAPGAYPGEQRWVHGTTFPHQVYYGDGIGWRGVHNGLNYRANPTTGSGISWYKTIGQHQTIATVQIPDLGTPYMVYPSARIEAWFGEGTRADFYIRLGTDTGTRMTWTSANFQAYVNPPIPLPPGESHLPDIHNAVNIAPMMYGPISGPTTIYLTGALWAQKNSNYGWGLDRSPGAVGGTELNVMVYPSTLPPVN